MSIEYLVTLTYFAAILFMMMLFWGIGLVTAMRRMRFGAPIATSQYQPNLSSEKFQVINKPFGDWKEWNEKRRDNTGRIEPEVVMPMRYQQPQLFTEESTEVETQEPEPKAKAS